MSSSSDWVVKLGPLRRHNVASTRKLAEEGLTRMLNEAIEPLLAAVKPLQKIFLEGAVCPSGCVAPEVVEIKAELEIFSYELPNGHWFSQGIADGFGLKVVCKRASTPAT